MEIDVLFGPADFAGLPGRDLTGTACMVFDVLRATSTMATALANGAGGIRPVETIDEALSERRTDPSVLLAGERGGLRIGPELAGGVSFDFGNSPREFTAGRVAGRTLVMTTTNGTRALRACRQAKVVIAASFLNLGAAVREVGVIPCPRVLLVASGTGEETALEDVMAAGAAVERLVSADAGGRSVKLSDAARIAQGVWRSALPDFHVLLREARNARRLLAIPDLAPDVDVCLAVDALEVVPRLHGGRDLRGYK